MHDIACTCRPGFTGDGHVRCSLCKYLYVMLNVIVLKQSLLDEIPLNCLFIALVPTPEVDSVVVGCESDQECPDYNACQNRKCINPCAEDDPCAPSANCKVIGHQPVCTCPDGYIGDPRTECKLRKLLRLPYENTNTI